MLKIGCCGNTETYEKTSAMGYDYIELSARQIMTLSDEEFEAFLQTYRKVGFPCRAFNDFCGADIPIVGPGFDPEKTQKYVEKLMARGKALGIMTAGIGAPSARSYPLGYTIEQADADMLAFLKIANDAAKKNGIIVLVEAVHQYLCNYLNFTADALEIVKRFGDPNVKMVLDYYQAKVMQENMHDFAYVMPVVCHLHTSTDLQNHARGFLHEEDVRELRQLLQDASDLGYNGGISVEPMLTNLESEGSVCARCMRKAIEGIQ